jgi:hypothetical protein
MREIDQEALAINAGFDAEEIVWDTAPMAIMEEMADAQGYAQESKSAVGDREFVAGEFAPGGGWEVLVGKKYAMAVEQRKAS